MNGKDSLLSIKGIGEKTNQLFHKLHIDTIMDLADHFPRYYEEFTPPVSLSEMETGTQVAVLATIHSRVRLNTFSRMKICAVTVHDKETTKEFVWFNAPFLSNVFHVGDSYIFVGRPIYKNGTVTLEHPAYYTKEQYEKLLYSLQPVYHLTKGLTNNAMKKALQGILPFFETKQDWLTDNYLSQKNYLSLGQSYKQMHFPKRKEDVIPARRRFVLNEFFQFLLWMDHMKEHAVLVPNEYPVTSTAAMNELQQKLPYTLTCAQQNTIYEIQQDMMGDYAMNRLIQGDVGSGKTIVALCAMVMAIESGYQCALMAPTEVLANQHFNDFIELLKDTPYEIASLTGSMTKKQKEEVYTKLESGRIQLIIGTHALIQDKVTFKNLGLVVTDEQHRFGVKQRETLSKKGLHPHILMLSATPIPRSLALMLYGDLSISIMNELPKSRLPIKNCVVPKSYRKTAYHFMEQEIQKGHQIYIICPMVEENDELELENVTSYAKQLISIFPPHTEITYLHGKMKQAEKDHIMEEYQQGKIDILVSTTVIEVGINVPNATVMMIENAERFGLAALHQLRGRVGRGADQSYCIFMYGKESKETTKRLEILNHSNDGFFIAQEDLKLRGPGDFFGIRQSGEFAFHLADIYQDASILEDAKQLLDNFKEEKSYFTASVCEIEDQLDQLSITI